MGTWLCTATAADIQSAQAQAAVTQAQANLDTLTAPASDSDLASAEAAVTQAQVAVDTAQANLDQATLTAPCDGIEPIETAAASGYPEGDSPEMPAQRCCSLL